MSKCHLVRYGLALVLGMALLTMAVACGTAASPSPSRTPTPSLTPTATPTPTIQPGKGVVSIIVTPAEPASLQVGETINFTAMGTFSDGTSADITTLVGWGSSELGVAEIGTDGLATAIGNGVTTIAVCYQGVCRAVELSVGP